MYKNFYGLKRNPFEISPDPYFFYPTARHNEALANLYYGIRRQKGFVVLTGEVGTGKTLLLRCLLDLLNKNQVAFAYVFNPRLSAIEFLHYVVGDLGLQAPSQGKGDLLLELNRFLINRYRQGLTTVLVVDEAQQLSHDVLEEIRLLTNLETSQRKLLQILLVGQPELDQTLDSPSLRQLKQRIALRCTLEPLTETDARSYIGRRLQLASMGGKKEPFSEAAIKAVYRHSKGIPRLINTLCENALISGYARQMKVIDAATVDEVARDFGLGRTVSPPEQKDLDTKAALRALFQMIQSLDREPVDTNKVQVRSEST